MSKEAKKCIRCCTMTKDFPKPSNDKTCGSCLHDLHEMHKKAVSLGIVDADDAEEGE